jgi:hypothetical protein
MPPRFEHEHDDEHEDDLVAAPPRCVICGSIASVFGLRASVLAPGAASRERTETADLFMSHPKKARLSWILELCPRSFTGLRKKI